MYLANLKTTFFNSGQKYDFVFPFGSTEQHGPFAPLGTDSMTTTYLVEQLNTAYPNIIIIPQIDISRSQEHRGFAGTVYLKPETMVQVIYDMCTSLKDYAQNIMLFSFHYNDPVFEDFIKNHSEDFPGIRFIVLDILGDEVDEPIIKKLGGPIDGHAGNTEISTIFYLHPETVTIPFNDYPKKYIEEAFATDNIKDFSDNGISDNHPQWIVNKELGRFVLEQYTEKLFQSVDNFLQK